MIRKEMNQLEKEGYLASPHTSAGRVPTDKAYRLYIQENMPNKSNPSTTLRASKTNGLTSKETEKVSTSLKKNWPDEQSLFKEISRLTSELSKELSVAGTLDGESTYSFGFSNLFDEPEFKSFENMNQIMKFMDNMDSCFDILWNPVRNRARAGAPEGPLGRAVSNGMNDDLQVFIGNENPIKEINEFTLITGRYQLPEGESGFVSIIGPKRMNYKRNMALIEYIADCLNRQL
jgi:heat-inducible transcriptional repressor